MTAALGLFVAVAAVTVAVDAVVEASVSTDNNLQGTHAEASLAERPPGAGTHLARQQAATGNPLAE